MATSVPNSEELLTFVRKSGRGLSKQDIVRAFSLKSSDRLALKTLLASMVDAGLLSRGRNRRYLVPTETPPVGVVEIIGLDEDGTPIGRPVSWRPSQSSSRITVIMPRRSRMRALGIGDRALVRLSPIDEKNIEGRVMRRLEGPSGRMVGVVEKDRNGAHLRTVNRRGAQGIALSTEDLDTLPSGEVVVAEIETQRGYGLPQASVRKRLGHLDTPGTIERLICEELEIPTEFPIDAVALAKQAVAPTLKDRVDLRSLPLITIDDDDARDFDDAVWAEQDSDRSNPNGWKLIVAIADVAAYVKTDDPIDQEARRRGNSVYLPRLVVPMLPESLSNEWCSLKPKEPRACLAAHIQISREGTVLHYRFERALMQSAGRLTYTEVQAAHEGTTDKTTRPLRKYIEALYGAYASLKEARSKRNTLDFDLPERRILFNHAGAIKEIAVRPRYDSHRVIEEFMITANVVAAEILTKGSAPCMYRVHDQPPLDKLETLRAYLKELGYKLSRSRRLTPQNFQQILKKAKDSEHEEAVATVILRAQAQAEYSPKNIGHFGLNLDRYAHFTSPIRRYSDLLVHRSLIHHLDLGTEAVLNQPDETFTKIGAEVSETERRAVRAERGANDRYKTLFMADKKGAEFWAKVNSVTRFGLFVTINDIGAEGLIPMRVLSNQLEERIDHDSNRQVLSAPRTGFSFTIGQEVSVRLDEADTVTGGLAFSLSAFDPPDTTKSYRRSRKRYHR